MAFLFSGVTSTLLQILCIYIHKGRLSILDANKVASYNLERVFDLNACCKEVLPRHSGVVRKALICLFVMLREAHVN